MKPEIGQLNIFFDKDSVTTSESQQILNIVNVALGLASIDLIKEKNESKYESLKFSFYSYLYTRNKELAESVFESFLPSYDYDRNYLFERIDRLRYRLKDKIKEPYYEELLFLLEESYFDRKHRISNYSRRELQGRVIAELVENSSFEKRSFNTYDFSEWLNLETENRVSEIGLATTENSLEYEIKFLIIWGCMSSN